MKNLLMALFDSSIGTNIGNCTITNSYDRYGNVTGSFKTFSNGVVINCDRYGNETGSFKKTSSGEIIQFDRYGNQIGSFR